MSARAGDLRAWWRDFRCVLRAGGGGASVGGVSAMMLLCAALDLLGIGLVAPFVGLVMGQGATGLPAVLQGLVARVPLEALGSASWWCSSPSRSPPTACSAGSCASPRRNAPS